MEVVRVAYTTTELVTFGERSGYIPQYPTDDEPPDEAGCFEYFEWLKSLPREADELGEAAGRLCYMSWNRPNPTTATTEGYIANIIKQQHFSVLEHASVTYYVSGVSRSLLTELERHRHLSFSVVSQRYVDHSNAKYVFPPVFRELDASVRPEMESELASVVAAADEAYSYIYQTLRDSGVGKKQAREAARSVLPQATCTEFLMTGNLRTYREILGKRLSRTADAEIRQLAEMLLEDLKDYAPATFQDINPEE